ncbi:MAG: hypothetical protein AAFQ94_11155 [Bacteroidota bacterium]
MKNFLKNMTNKLRANFTILDFGFLKLYGALFGAVLGAMFHEFILTNIRWFVGAFVFLLLRFLYLMFLPANTKKKQTNGNRKVEFDGY